MTLFSESYAVEETSRQFVLVCILHEYATSTQNGRLFALNLRSYGANPDGTRPMF